MIESVITSAKHITTFTHPPALTDRIRPISCLSLWNWLEYEKKSETVTKNLPLFAKKGIRRIVTKTPYEYIRVTYEHIAVTYDYIRVTFEYMRVIYEYIPVTYDYIRVTYE